MQLSVKDAATLLNVAEKKIYAWIKRGELPAYSINEQYRFNRAELLQWATERGIRVSPEAFAGAVSGEGESLPGLVDALSAGGVAYGVGGGDGASVLRSVVERLPLPPDVDRDYLYQVMLARESLGSTGVGDGIAIPHVRNPLLLHVQQPTVTLCFLAQAIDFGALDGLAVDTMFAIVSPTVAIHLHLLSRLGFALRDPGFKAAVKARAPREALLAELAKVEGGIAGHGSPARG